MKLKQLVVGFVAAILAAQANADARATLEDFYDSDGILVSQRVIVYISQSEKDKELPGAHFIGVRLRHQEIGQYTRGQWEPWQGGLFNTAQAFLSLPKSETSYTVLDGRLICSLTGYGEVEIWAGYGVLTPEFEDIVTKYHSTANPRIPADHIRHMYVQSDMLRNGKYWNVLNYNCSAISGG